MFSWATGHLERLAQTVAPPPSDPCSRYLLCCQSGDEASAQAALGELQDVGMIVHPVTGRTALHVACLHSLPNLIHQVLQQRPEGLGILDSGGNSVLHCAAMSNKRNAVDIVKWLVTDCKASVTAKNSQGQTAYDVAPLDLVRQFLLPLQLQEETRIALDNGGVGLIPGMDLGGLKVNRPNLAPPPIVGSSSAQAVGPEFPPHPRASGVFTASEVPPHSGPAIFPPQAQEQEGPAPGIQPQSGPPSQPGSSATFSSERHASSAPTSSGGPREYSLRGYSSAAIEVKGRRALKPDGFHSSSSDKRLQEKYGHQSLAPAANVPPPPRSGSFTTPPLTAPAELGTSNPYSGGYSLPGVNRLPANRYVAVDPITGQSMALPPRSGGFGAPTYGSGGSKYLTPPPYSNFQPKPSQSVASPTGAPVIEDSATPSQAPSQQPFGFSTPQPASAVGVARVPTYALPPGSAPVVPTFFQQPPLRPLANFGQPLGGSPAAAVYEPPGSSSAEGTFQPPTIPSPAMSPDVQGSEVATFHQPPITVSTTFPDGQQSTSAIDLFQQPPITSLTKEGPTPAANTIQQPSIVSPTKGPDEQQAEHLASISKDADLRTPARSLSPFARAPGFPSVSKAPVSGGTPLSRVASAELAADIFSHSPSPDKPSIGGQSMAPRSGNALAGIHTTLAPRSGNALAGVQTVLPPRSGNALPGVQTAFSPRSGNNLAGTQTILAPRSGNNILGKVPGNSAAELFATSVPSATDMSTSAPSAASAGDFFTSKTEVGVEVPSGVPANSQEGSSSQGPTLELSKPPAALQDASGGAPLSVFRVQKNVTAAEAFASNPNLEGSTNNVESLQNASLQPAQGDIDKSMDDEEFEDVCLSPRAQDRTGSFGNQQQPAEPITPSNSLYAAIGMPPPPFSKK